MALHAVAIAMTMNSHEGIMQNELQLRSVSNGRSGGGAQQTLTSAQYNPWLRLSVAKKNYKESQVTD